MLTREYIELFVEDGFEANLTSLIWRYCDVLVLLLPLLVAQLFRILREVFKVVLQLLDAVLVVGQTLAELVLHVLDFLVGWEQWQEIVDLEPLLVGDDLDRLSNAQLLRLCVAKDSL
jgi:hypothetical protein